MRPIRVLDLRDTHEIGGPGKTILETYRAIDPARFELHLGVFVTRHETGDSPFVAAARACGMPVHLVRGYNQYDPRMIARVAALVRRLRIDILHAHEVKSDVITWLAAKLCRVRTMTTLHGWIPNSRKQRFLIALDRRVVRRFDRVVVVSKRIQEALEAAGVPAGRVRLVHNAIVLDRYRRAARDGFLAGLVGQPLAGPVIASIGRISREKGHADLVDAVGMAAQRGVQVSVVLAGDGPERPRLAERIHALGLDGRVHLVGYVSQPERILQEADLMVLPSHTEGLPNAALEALAMEVPVLATRVGGTPEVIADGETGRLVEARSPRALADAIVDFVADPAPWQAMAKRGRDVVQSQFSFDTRTRRMEALYDELAGVTR